MPRSLTLLVLALSLTSAPMLAGDALPRAQELIKARQYEDAIRELAKDLSAKPDAETAQQQFWTGECHYLLKRYDQAKTFYTRALGNLQGREKSKAEYRLACTLYRMNDAAAAIERIDGYITTYGMDRSAGTLLLFKMTLVSARGMGAMADLEAIHALFASDAARGKLDPSAQGEADGILCAFYAKHGLYDKAFAYYRKIASSLRKQMDDLERERRTVPLDLVRQAEAVALQLGILHVERKEAAEARKWLSSIKGDIETVGKARLMLAKLALESNDAKGAQEQILRGDILNQITNAQTRSGLYLVLGLAEKSKTDADHGKIADWLGKVAADSKGYAQAQIELGDLYLQRTLYREAITAFALAASNAEYEARSLFGEASAQLALFKNGEGSDRGTKANELFKKLFQRHPLSVEAKRAKPLLAALKAKGLDIAYADSEADRVGGWQQIAKEKPGSIEAAQALLLLAREHARSTSDPKGVVLKAADWAACAAACDTLLDDKVYSGKGLAADVWQTMRVDALCLRGSAELASLPGAVPPAGEQPVPIKKPSAEKAVTAFTTAKTLVDAKDQARNKTIAIGLLEAQFKSDNDALRQAASDRYAELEPDYGDDPRFQKLTVDLAEWHRAGNRPALAAAMYLKVAKRSNLGQEDSIRLLYTAGTLFSRAGQQALTQKTATQYAIHITSKPAIAVSDDPLVVAPALQTAMEWSWPNGGKMNAEQALIAMSKQSGIAFVWPASRNQKKPDPESVHGQLVATTVTLHNGTASPAAVIASILDQSKWAVAIDLGLSGGTPTPTNAVDADSARESLPVLEVYPRALGYSRIAALRTEYGRGVNGDGGPATLFAVLKRVEKLTNLRITWGEGIDREHKLAAEFKALPGDLGTKERAKRATVLDVLSAVLDSQGLRFSVVKSNPSEEFFDRAKDCYNDVRKQDARSGWGERAMMAVARDFHQRRDYEKMKIILREYLKTFDSNAHPFFHEANFWVGYCYEQDRKWHDAGIHYARAGEERLVIYRPLANPTAVSASTSGSASSAAAIDRSALRRALSYESGFALNEDMACDLVTPRIEDVVELVKAATHLPMRIDASASGAGPFSLVTGKRSALTVLCDALDSSGLMLRGEHLSPDFAERALYRLALVQRKDGILPQAIESAELLLQRYPQTTRRRETYQILLDSYRGLNRFGEVIATLDRLAAGAQDPEERRRIAVEIAWMHFDMADYATAVARLEPLLSGAPEGEAKQRLRDGYARALSRAGRHADAAAQLDLLAKEATRPSEQRVWRLRALAARVLAGSASAKDLPEDDIAFVRTYQGMSESEREQMAEVEQSRLCLIYWVRAQDALRNKRDAEAYDLLNTIGGARDEVLAAEALVLTAIIDRAAGRLDAARKTLEYLLISTSVAEAKVRSTFMLAEILSTQNQPLPAQQRYQQVVTDYPLSPLAAEASRRLKGAAPSATVSVSP